MASNPKVLGQSAPAANTDTTLFLVPTATSAVVSTLTVCNLGSYTTYRIAVRPEGATLQRRHYVVYDAPIDQGTTQTITIGIGLEASDVLTVRSASGDIAFSAFGMEIT